MVHSFPTRRSSDHGNVDAIKRGREGGATVLARSGFTVQLPALLTEVAERERARIAG